MIQIPHRRRQQAYKAIRIALVVMVILSIPMGIALAQTADDPPVCEDGPPIRGDFGETAEREILLLNDESGSMNQIVTGSTTRFDVLKESVGQFIEGANESTEIGHVSNSPPTLKVGLTTNHTLVNETVQSLEADGLENQDDGQAMLLAKNELLNGTNATDGAVKVVVYATDGLPINGTAAIERAEELQSEGVVIYTVGIGDEINESYMIDVAGSEDRYYANPNPENLTEIYTQIEEDVESLGGLSIETRDLYGPAETYPYTVYEYIESPDGTTERNEVTGEANLTIRSAYNGTLLTVNDNGTLTAVDDENVSDWARIDAAYNGSVGCTNVVVSSPSVEHIELIPGIWRLNALIGDSTIFFILLATLAAVATTRFTSSFAGLAIAQMVMVVGWFAGYVAWVFAVVSLFVGLFIGLNLAANIDYSVGRFKP